MYFLSSLAKIFIIYKIKPVSKNCPAASFLISFLSEVVVLKVRMSEKYNVTQLKVNSCICIQKISSAYWYVIKLHLWSPPKHFFHLLKKTVSHTRVPDLHAAVYLPQEGFLYTGTPDMHCRKWEPSSNTVN